MHMQKQYKHDSESSIIQETAQLRCTEPHTPCAELHTSYAEMVLDSRLHKHCTTSLCRLTMNC